MGKYSTAATRGLWGGPAKKGVSLGGDGAPPFGWQVMLHFEPANSTPPPNDPSLTQRFGPGDELYDQHKIIYFGAWVVNFGVVLNFASVIFEDEAARTAFDYASHLTQWYLGGVDLKGATWGTTVVPIDGVNTPGISTTDTPQSDKFRQGASHLLEWHN